MTKPKKTPYPEGFAASDEVRGYCGEKWGHEGIADAALADFRKYHEDQIAEGSPKKYRSWDRAFKNFILWSSPAGRYHSPRQWEGWLEIAKRAEYGDRRRHEPAYDPRGPREQVRTPALAHEHLANLKSLLR